MTALHRKNGAPEWAEYQADKDRAAVAYPSYYMRRYRGWTHEDAISTPPRRTAYGTYTRAFRASKAQHTPGLKYFTYRERRAVHGWSHTDAISRPIRKSNRKAFWDANKDRAAVGISYRTFTSRITSGWDWEAALTAPKFLPYKLLQTT